MDISLSDWQEEIILCPSRFVLCAGGRKVGKSFLAAKKLQIASLSNKNFKAMVATPTGSQHDEIIEAFWKTEGIRDFVIRESCRPTRFYYKNGSYNEFRTLEGDQRVRSKGMNLLIADEVQNIHVDTYESVLRPIVSGTQGQIMMLGQMRPGSWHHIGYFLPGQATPGSEINPMDFGVPRYKSWLIPSSRGPMFQSERGKKELEIAKSQIADWRFQLEYEGTLAGDEPDTCFPWTQLQKVIIGEALKEPEARPFSAAQEFIMGLDIGRMRDPSACVILNRETGQVEYCENFPRGMLHGAQAHHAAMISKKWNNAVVIIDGTGGGAPGRLKNAEEYIALYRAACPRHEVLYQVWQTKQVFVEGLALTIEQRKINIPATMSMLIDELRQYKFEYKNGFFKYGGDPDNLVSSLYMSNFVRTKEIGVGDPAGLPLSRA